MKKIAILFVCSILMLVLAPISVASENVTVNGVTFEIPDQYSNGDIDDNSYILDSVYVFGIVANLNSPLHFFYGNEAVNKDNSENLTIGTHDVVHIVDYIDVRGYDVSFAYFVCGDTFYCISWKGTEMTPDIANMIRNSPDSDYTYNEFHDLLNEAEIEHMNNLTRQKQEYNEWLEYEELQTLREIEENTQYHHHYWRYY